MNQIVFSFIDLYSRSVVELTADNAKSVKSLLLKYTQLFAALDADLGQTKVITHNIDTGTAILINSLLGLPLFKCRRRPIAMLMTC